MCVRACVLACGVHTAHPVIRVHDVNTPERSDTPLDTTRCCSFLLLLSTSNQRHAATATMGDTHLAHSHSLRTQYTQHACTLNTEHTKNYPLTYSPHVPPHTHTHTLSLSLSGLSLTHSLSIALAHQYHLVLKHQARDRTLTKRKREQKNNNRPAKLFGGMQTKLHATQALENHCSSSRTPIVHLERGTFGVGCGVETTTLEDVLQGMLGAKQFSSIQHFDLC
jgi:hypothetical protein